MPEKNCRGSLYQDDGHSFAYQRGELLARQLFLPGFARFDHHYFCNREELVSAGWNTAEITVYGANTQPKELRPWRSVDP